MLDRQTIVSFASVKSASYIAREEKEKEGYHLNWETFLCEDSDVKRFNEEETMGYGIERCLYELNPDLKCLSPNFVQVSVLTPAEALVALEEVAVQNDRPFFPMDRHLAAFLISRWKGLNFIDVRNMGKPQREVRNLATLKVLAAVQSHFKVRELPNLCQWMAQICGSMIIHAQNKEARTGLEKEIEKAVCSGKLINLVYVFESHQVLGQDNNDYQEAKIEALLIESEIKEVENSILNFNRSISSGLRGLPQKLIRLRYGLRFAKIIAQKWRRIAFLYRQLQNLFDIWGENILPQARNSPSDFWRKIWIKINIPKSF